MSSFSVLPTTIPSQAWVDLVPMTVSHSAMFRPRSTRQLLHRTQIQSARYGAPHATSRNLTDFQLTRLFALRHHTDFQLNFLAQILTRQRTAFGSVHKEILVVVFTNSTPYIELTNILGLCHTFSIQLLGKTTLVS
jgi:hypothetical protein